MTEFLFLLITLFIIYLVYNSVSEKKQKFISPVQKVTEQPPVVPVPFQENPEKAVLIATSTEQQLTPSSKKKSGKSTVAVVSKEKQKTPVKPKTPRMAPKLEQPVASIPVAIPVSEINVPKVVGLTAGNIWNYLDTNGSTSVAKLIRELQDDQKTIQRSIGWLAQEGKITLEAVDGAETITLKK